MTNKNKEVLEGYVVDIICLTIFFRLQENIVWCLFSIQLYVR